MHMHSLSSYLHISENSNIILKRRTMARNILFFIIAQVFIPVFLMLLGVYSWVHYMPGEKDNPRKKRRRRVGFVAFTLGLMFAFTISGMRAEVYRTHPYGFLLWITFLFFCFIILLILGIHDLIRSIKELDHTLDSCEYDSFPGQEKSKENQGS